MEKIEFNFEWVSSEDASGEELRNTWAKFSLVAGGNVVTLIHEKYQKTVNEHIYMPLYPVAEWLIYNCWFLFNEKYTPGKFDEVEFEKRHNLKFAEEGYSLPDVQFVPEDDVIRISWRPISYEYRNSEFIGHGSTLLGLEKFKYDVFQFIEKVVRRLEDRGITDTFLQNEWKEYLTLETEEIDFCNAVSAIGLDPFHISKKLSDSVINVSNILPVSLLQDFYAVTKDTTFDADVDLTLKAVNLQKQNSLVIEKFKSIRDGLIRKHKFSNVPWEEGYKAAQELRKVLNLNGQAISGNDELSEVFKISETQMKGIFHNAGLPFAINAISGSNSEKSPSIVIDNRSEKDGASLTFTFCRALYDYFFSENLRPTLITKTKTTTQKTNRAFAAEFIMPAKTLRKSIKSSAITREEIHNLAFNYNVSPYVIEYQVVNHQIAKIESE